jgi:3-keto-disaccharide hydrolase
MKRSSVIAMVLLVIGLNFVGCVHQPSDRGDAGWITLFDGSNLDHWYTIGKANWRLVDGLVQADKGSGHLVSKNSYADFQIRAEFWVDANANSGIHIRCADPQKPSSTTCYEVNIYDKRPDQEYGTGAIVNYAKVSPMPKAGGRWNTLEITAKGPQLTAILNGSKTAEVQDSKYARGPITIQYSAGVVKIRKVEIKPL